MNLPATALEMLCARLEAAVFPKKSFLLQNGERCKYDYLVKKGCIKVGYIDEKGQEKIVKFAIEGMWVVDLESFLNQSQAFYYLEAVTPTEVFQLSLDNYQFLLQNSPDFVNFQRERWQQGFIALQQRVLQGISMNAEAKYAAFLAKYPGLEQRIPQKLIAAYLGITPEFLSMLRARPLQQV